MPALPRHDVVAAYGWVTKRAMDAPRHDTASLWQPFVAGLRAFVARRTPAQDAEDITQDILLRLHQNAASLRDSTRAEAWVYSIARRTIADYYRARRPAGELTDSEAEAIPDPQAAPPRGFGTFTGRHNVHEEVLSWLRPMAEALPDGYRQALLMADFEGRRQQEVADALGLSLSGAKSRVQRARSLLGDALRRCCEIERSAEGRVVDFKRHDCAC